ncbi:DNA alkylation repair protein [Orenia marismortui]|uniref:DNA alkylation repair protein n=1 Tax=Orenia marismortui TaxID=46469 RepID=UPI0003814921|nr:DNA alkylation repair protein [Orenia marismortui]
MDKKEDMIEVINRVKKVKRGFKGIEKESKEIRNYYGVNECFEIAQELFKYDSFQVRMLATFIMGSISYELESALVFLKERVSLDENWRVQEILAKAFDTYCENIGYNNSLQTIKDWLNSDNPNVRRAVTEGLRIWTSRDYFKQNPQIAVNILGKLKSDNSEYVRKSVGNALKDISKKHKELVKQEIETWNLSNGKIKQTYKFAIKYLDSKRGIKNE